MACRADMAMDGKINVCKVYRIFVLGLVAFDLVLLCCRRKELHFRHSCSGMCIHTYSKMIQLLLIESKDSNNRLARTAQVSV